MNAQPPGDLSGEVTALLRRWKPGDAGLEQELVASLYPELKRIARNRMRRERADHTLQPTALINEFFLHIAQQDIVSWQSRAHFLAVASQAMRRLLIDHARSRDASKRGGGLVKLQLNDLNLPSAESTYDLLEINDALERLQAEEPRMAEVAHLRCFGGLTHEEIAEMLGVDERTVKRDWQVARAWLFGQLRKGKGHVPG